MIILLTTSDNADTWRFFLAGWGKDIAGDIRRMTYQEALSTDPGDLPRGAWLFTDFDIFERRPVMRMARMWQALSDRGDRLLNHPTRSMRRFQLLRTLKHLGINEHDVHRADDPRRPRRFPVFVRNAASHSGPLTRLIPDAATLDRFIGHFLDAGWPLESLLVIEHLDTREASGACRTYAAMRVGDRIIPDHLWFSDAWMIKARDAWQLAGSRVDVEALRRQEQAYLAENPHAEQLMRIFELARIEYGRIDYGMKDGRIEVWEINSNPELSDAWNEVHESYRADVRTRFGRRFVDALRAIDPG